MNWTLQTIAQRDFHVIFIVDIIFEEPFFLAKNCPKTPKKSYTSDAHKDFSDKKDVVNEDDVDEKLMHGAASDENFFEKEKKRKRKKLF